jgi:glucuronate isomerase
MEKLILDENRFFDAEPSVRKIARELYEAIKDLPIVSPHGHVDPRLFSENKPFPDPTELILIPDHYIFRMLYSQGIPLESLGVPTVDGSEVEKDHRKIWQTFADHYYLFAGTPTGIWLNHEFSEVFGIKEKLNSDSAMHIYDQIQEKLKSPEFLPRTMFERFNIEVLSTTDAAADTLDEHRKIKDSGWEGKVVPCFRPDAVVNLDMPNWRAELTRLSNVCGYEIDDYEKYIKALNGQRGFFKEMGAVSTDHAVVEPYTNELSQDEAGRLFEKALKGNITEQDAKLFSAHMLMEMARMSIEDGLTMQIHPGSLRNHNNVIFNKFGLDKGCDIPVATEYTRNLRPLLNKYGNDPRLTLIVFTLDESNYARELAPLAGHYPAMKLGPAWWFHDSLEGMTRYRMNVSETAGFYNTVGFNDDTRAFPSIPARHDLARRVDANFVARLTARHIIDINEARKIMKALTRDLVKKAYHL